MRRSIPRRANRGRYADEELSTSTFAVSSTGAVPGSTPMGMPKSKEPPDNRIEHLLAVLAVRLFLDRKYRR
jgi:hypothetical protein